MSNSYVSDELFHFVGFSSPNDNAKNYETLCKVLNSGCVSHPPHDSSCVEFSYKIEWKYNLDTEKLIVPNVTCFADIPFDALSIHVRKYGKFGIALPRWRLIERGARPVMYFPMSSDDWKSIYGQTLLNDIEAIVKGFNENAVKDQHRVLSHDRSLDVPPRSQEEAVMAMQSMVHKDFLAFIKPFNAELSPYDRDNFYMEREWRKYGNMMFEPEHLTRIIVASGYKDHIENDFPSYKGRIFEI